ncbi:hypothetical protein SNE40_015045 [Patella caerulea]|uniref:Uncharacterized protein n=1 Tax=Patella caerulea TaxID=87958 RepID=A0AAN8PRE6_PATCE
MGVKPDNITAFSIQACSVENSMYNCSLAFMKTLENDATCPDVEQTAIKQFFRSMFISYDNKCAHPCREYLMTDLSKCYTDSGLDANLFLSNATMERGTIIGTTVSEVKLFCDNRQPLVRCMRRERDMCPEAPLLMSKIGLDIESLERTVDVLCEHPEVYLGATECFSHPSIGVLECQNNQSTELIQLGVETKEESLSEDMFIAKFCQIRIKHVDCDLKAWSAIDTQSCGTSVIGLRTELECKLLPDFCTSNYQKQVDVICHKENFNKDDRKDDDSGAASVSGSIISRFLLCICILSLFWMD